MTLLPLTLSLLSYTVADYFQDRYVCLGGIHNSEWYKVFFLLTVLCAIMIPAKPIIILVWILWHYPIQQIGQGYLRHGNWLYLGVGGFDSLVKKLTFGKSWIYVLSMVLSLITGLWLYLRYCC